MFDAMDCHMRDGKKTKAMWISSYNFLCLLNIPQQVRLFGSVFHHWEGAGMGEQFVQVAKKHFRSLRKNWHTNLITKIVKLHSMSILSGSAIENSEFLQENVSQCKYQNKMMSIHTYSSSLIPVKDLRMNKPIAFVQLEDHEFAISVSSQTHQKLTIESYVKEVCGMHYFIWKIDMNSIKGELHIRRSCILLPI